MEQSTSGVYPRDWFYDPVRRAWIKIEINDEDKQFLETKNTDAQRRMRREEDAAALAAKEKS